MPDYNLSELGPNLTGVETDALIDELKRRYTTCFFGGLSHVGDDEEKVKFVWHGGRYTVAGMMDHCSGNIMFPMPSELRDHDEPPED